MRFFWQGQEHEIEIYHDTAVMLTGDRLYEVYLQKEFVDNETYASGFSARLDRYLSGGEWAGLNESGAFLSLLRTLWARLRL